MTLSAWGRGSESGEPYPSSVRHLCSQTAAGSRRLWSGAQDCGRVQLRSDLRRWPDSVWKWRYLLRPPRCPAGIVGSDSVTDPSPSPTRRRPQYPSVIPPASRLSRPVAFPVVADVGGMLLILAIGHGDRREPVSLVEPPSPVVRLECPQVQPTRTLFLGEVEQLRS
jgi:hypothetical protein